MAHFKYFEVINPHEAGVYNVDIVTSARLGGSDQLYPFCSCTQESASFPGPAQLFVALPYWK